LPAVFITTAGEFGVGCDISTFGRVGFGRVVRVASDRLRTSNEKIDAAARVKVRSLVG